MGTHSAGETSGENFAIATTLEDALTKFPTPVQLQLFLNKPELVAPEDLTVLAGQPITGRVPAAPASAVAADSKVRITMEKQADSKRWKCRSTPPATGLSPPPRPTAS